MKVPHYLPLPDEITVQNPPVVKTRAGGFVDDWITVMSGVEAQVIPTNAEEYVVGGKLQTVMLYSILVKADIGGIVPNQRILWGGRELYIMGVYPELAQNGVQVITASERPHNEMG